MANPKVTISVEISDKGSDAAFARMKARFEQLEDVSDKAVAEIGKSLNEKMASGFASGGEREYLESIRRLQPELKQLHQNIKNGLFDLTDYNRRMKSLDPATRSAIAAANQLGTAFNRVGGETEHGTNGLGKLLVGLNLLERGADAAIQKLRDLLTNAVAFGREIASLDTILEKGSDVSKFRDGILSLNPALGDSIELTKGLKLALGSGIKEAEGLDFLRLSAEAAKGGVADLSQTIDASTTILASYKLQTKDAAMVYDKMFQVVRDGKIEMGELSSKIGSVSSIASLAGISLDEMFAAVATATLSGKPAESIEGLRTAIANIVKPSEQAIELSKSLGLEFNAAALQSKGLAKFLEEVSQKTGNSVEKLAILFGDIQGLNIITKIAGENADEFAARLANMGSAAGNSSAAFAKTQLSLGAQMDATGVLIERGFLKVFSAIEPILSFALSVINKYPAPFLVAAIAVGALTAAHLLYNTQLVITVATAIPNLIKSIGNTIVVMVQMTGALLTGSAAMSTFSATAMVAFTAGWGLIAIAVIAAGVAIYNMETAIDRANNVTLDSINANTQSLQSYQQLAVEARDVAAAQEGSADRHDKLNAILGRLDPVTQTYIKSLTDEKQQINAVTQEIESNIEVRRAALEATLRTVAYGILPQKQSYEQVSAALKSYQTQINVAQADLDKYTNVPVSQRTAEQSLAFSEAREATLIYSQKIIDAKSTLDGLNTSLIANEIKLAQSAKGLGMSSEHLREFFTHLGYTKQQIDFLVSGYDRANGAQDELTGKFQKGTDAVNEGTNALGKYRDQLKGLISDTRAKIDEKVAEIITNATDKASALSRARDAMRNDGQLKELLQKNKFYKDTTEGVEKIIGLTSERATGTTGRRSSSDRGITERLPSSGAGFAAYNPVGGRLDPRRQFGTPETIANLQTIAGNWAQLSNKILSIGDISKQGGGTYNLDGRKRHDGHQGGTEADIRALRKDGKALPVRYDDTANYDQAATRKLFEVIKATKPGVKIYFNDKQLIKEGLAQQLTGHDDHAHLKNLGGGRVSGGDNFVEDYAEKARRALEEQSNNLTKAGQEKNIRQAIEFYKRSGLVPTGEMLDKFQNLAADEAKKAGVIQPSKELVAAAFEANRRNKLDARGLIVSNSTVSADITPQQTLDEKYISDLRESLNLKERYTNYVLLENSLMEEVSTRLEDQSLARSEAIQVTQVEYQLLLRRNSVEEISLKFLQSRNDQLKELGDTEQAIAVLRKQNSDDQFSDQRRLLASKREQLSLEQNITDLRDQITNVGANDALEIEAAQLRDVLDLRRRELDAVININRSQMELDHQMDVSNNQIRAKVLAHLSSQKNLNESFADGIIGVYDKVADKLDANIDRMTEKLGVFGSLVGEPLKAFARNSLSKITSGLLDSILPPEIADAFKEGSDNPIVNQQLETNKHLKNIERALTSPIGGIGSAGGGTTIGSVVGALGGSGSGGALNNPNVIKNLVGGYNSGSGTRTGDVVDGVSQVFAGDKGRQDIFSNLKNLFSTKDGGMFAARGGSAMAGKLGGAGAIAAMVGGFLPGKLGSVVSMAGTGMSIGANFGPWGALAGAAIGGLIGLFGGDPKRKADKKENLPKLQQGFTDALAQLRELSANKNAIISDPDGAIAKAVELRGQIASGFGIQFQSKKYRTQATAQIASKVVEADSILAGIREFAKKAYSAKSLEGQIVGEFATGTYMSPEFLAQYKDFKRRNGMMAGAFTGKDTLPALIAQGEMVLNPRQIANVIRAAGGDPFPYAGIPNYPTTSASAPPVRGYAEGNYFGTSAPTVMTPPQRSGDSGGDINIYITAEHRIDAEGIVTTVLQTSSTAGKAVKVIVEDKYSNGEMKLVKR